MAAGARAVAFGTINYIDPLALPRALNDLTAFLEQNDIADVNDLVGAAHEEPRVFELLKEKVPTIA
jgi:dihydroorotate dehydrogenase (NAD+) catalytic subunit